MTTPKAQREAEKLDVWRLALARKDALAKAFDFPSASMVFDEYRRLVRNNIRPEGTEPLEHCSQGTESSEAAKDNLRTERGAEQRSQGYSGRPEGGEE